MALTTISEAARNILNARENLALDIEQAQDEAGRTFSADDLWIKARIRKCEASIFHNLQAVGCDNLDEFAIEISAAENHVLSSLADETFRAMPEGFDFQVGRDLLDDFSKFTAIGEEN